MSMSNKKSNLRDFASRAKKLKKIIDDNFNLSFVKISKNLNLGQMMKKSTFRASASLANNKYILPIKYVKVVLMHYCQEEVKVT